MKMKLCDLYEQGDANRIEEIAKVLGNGRKYFGKPMKDRAAWEKLKNTLDARKYIEDAENLLQKPVIRIQDDVYLQFYKYGSRTQHDRELVEQANMIITLCIAECLEGKGRFLAKYEEAILALCDEPSWTINAHDKNLDTFYGRDIFIDLHVATSCLDLVHTDYLLGDAVKKSVRKTLHENINRRLVKPYLEALRGERPAYNWMSAPNNWNCVCLSSCMGVVLAMSEDAIEQAMAVTAFLTMTKYGTVAYKPDGYAMEELGYWGYGYSHLIVGIEALRRATDNAIDLQREQLFLQTGLFGIRSQITDKTVAWVSDCGANLKVSTVNNLYITKRLNLKDTGYDIKSGLKGDNYHLYTLLIFWFFDAPVLTDIDIDDLDTGNGIRNYFESSQVLIARPYKDKDIRLGLYVKGGDNHQSHNHLDVGNYVVTVNGVSLIVDAGCPPYNANTFGPHRFENKALNSFGHNVPFISGCGQKGITHAWTEKPEIIYKAEVLERKFTEENDSITYDITKAYNEPFIEKLIRNIQYNRTGNGKITITDSYKFSTPQIFENAFVTYSLIKIENNTLVLSEGNVGVRVTFNTEDISFEVEKLPECHLATPKKELVTPVRVGVRLSKEVEEGEFIATITPFKK